MEPREAAPTSVSAAAAKPRPPSLRLRLTLWMVVIALVIQLTLGLIIFLYQSSALNEIFDERLRDRTEALAASLERGTVRELLPDFEALAGRTLTFPPDEPRFVGVYDSAGARVATAGALPAPEGAETRALGLATRHGATLRSASSQSTSMESFRIIARRIQDREGRIYSMVAARPDNTFDEMLVHMRRVLALSLPVGVIGAGVAGWLIAGLAVAPVRRFREITDTLAPETIAEQAPPVDLGIAEFQDVQEALEEMRDRIRHAFMVRDRFIANVSHELKTPIAVILTEAQTLDVSELNRDGRLFVRSVIDETRRLSRTIESFLTLTKIRAGKSLMEHAPCSVSDFVMDAVLNCSRMARQKGVTLNPVLSEGEQAQQVIGDCELLRVMVDSLLRNAIASSPESSQVLVQVSEQATECTIAVRDAGRPDAPNGVIGRAGGAEGGGEKGDALGLSMAETIAELHAGRISTRVLPEGGTEFLVRLPCEPASTAMTPPPSEPAASR